jgi:hypothetical protein
MNKLNTSGEGTRPTTSGGVDNIGGADAFTPSNTPEGQHAAPQPEEKMRGKRQSATDSNRADKPAPGQSDS